MDRRYQIFISSTFKDLIEERQAVLKAVLELDHMPAGMELFPASDDSAWQLIQDIIDASDYYVLIIGGRYGSLDEAGIGYTEKEYDYAVKTGKPVIPLLHKKPDNLPREKTETDQAIWEKLEQFRKKVEGSHTCVYWEVANELKAQVIVGLTSAVKRQPGIGWIRANKMPDENTIAELLEVRKQVSDLEKQLEATKTQPPKESEDFAQGDDEINIKLSFTARRSSSESFLGYEETNYSANIDVTWNDIWKAISPTLINECTERELKSVFNRHFNSVATKSFENHKNLKEATLSNFSFDSGDIETCLVQFRALGLLKESIKQRSVKDTNTYWTLTPYGDKLMVNLRAIRKIPEPEKTLKAHVSNKNKD